MSTIGKILCYGIDFIRWSNRLAGLDWTGLNEMIKCLVSIGLSTEVVIIYKLNISLWNDLIYPLQNCTTR